MPPSDDQDSGKLVFNPMAFQYKQNYAAKNLQLMDKSDDLNFFNINSGKMLFICQSCYSGNIIEKWTKSVCVYVWVHVCVRVCLPIPKVFT